MMRVSDDVINILDRSKIVGQNLYLPEHLDRVAYLAVAKVLEAAGGKWSRKERAHIFAGIAADTAIDPIILTGEVMNAKQEFGFFQSTPLVVARVMEIANISAGMRVLEPSAGHGALALAASARDAVVDCIEILPANVQHLTELDRKNPRFHNIWQGDFLTFAPTHVYDRIVMNPPFAKQADIQHVLHAGLFLKPGGKLVSVMSAGVRFRDTKLTRMFRAYVEAAEHDYEDLPDGSFKESGTGVRACIVSFTR
jgi:predicted RNA methylase